MNILPRIKKGLKYLFDSSIAVVVISCSSIDYLKDFASSYLISFNFTNAD